LYADDHHAKQGSKGKALSRAKRMRELGYSELLWIPYVLTNDSKEITDELNY